MMLRITAWLMLHSAPIESLELLLPGSAGRKKSDWSTLIVKTEVSPILQSFVSPFQTLPVGSSPHGCNK